MNLIIRISYSVGRTIHFDIFFAYLEKIKKYSNYNQKLLFIFMEVHFCA